jgi:hypothetical protein
MAAQEERHAGLAFERLDLFADSAGRDVQRLGRTRQAALPGGRFEGDQRRERWQADMTADHDWRARLSLMLRLI